MSASRRGWGKSIIAKGKKTDSHPAAFGAKVAIRNKVLNTLGPGSTDVFEGFSGEGRLYRAVWHRACSCVGCDLKWYQDSREAFVADSKRVMRAIDLNEFNCFDFDAYGSPWVHVMILIGRRPVAAGERIGIVLTDGSSLKIRHGSLPYALAKLSGFSPHLAGASRAEEMIINRAIAGTAQAMNCRILSRWQATGKTGAAVRYIGLILEGLPGLRVPAEPRPARVSSSDLPVFA